MQALFIEFPNISPEIFSFTIGGMEFALRWYALAYVVGILIGYWIAQKALKTERIWPHNLAPMLAEDLERFLTWIILGVVLGGRIGYVLFYQPAYFLENPQDIIKVWEGGMSFHGGFLGVVLATWMFCNRNGIRKRSAADLLALAAPPGILLGRIANFINGELWGRPTTSEWGVVFPGAAAQNCPGFESPCARHPSQLYEAGLEGLVLGIIILVLAFYGNQLKAPGRLMGVFFMGYGASRFFVEYFRQADAQFITPDNPMGYVLQLGDYGMSMGQILSVPMILLGLYFVLTAKRAEK